MNSHTYSAFRDIVQSSKESNVPCWMLLPITGCFFVGSVFLFSPSSAIAGNSESTNSQWVGVLYIVGVRIYPIIVFFIARGLTRLVEYSFRAAVFSSRPSWGGLLDSSASSTHKTSEIRILSLFASLESMLSSWHC